MTQSTTLSKSNTAVQIILQAGLLAGTLDILAAFTNAYLSTGTSPLAVLRFVASGVFGQYAFTGGIAIALAGLLFHFIIATGWATLYYLLYPMIRKITSNWLISGLIYGIIVWTLMRFVILPLSNVTMRPFQFNYQTFIAIGIIMIFVGLPIAWVVQKKYSSN